MCYIVFFHTFIQFFILYKLEEFEWNTFQKISLNPEETKTVTFIIDNQKLSFYNQKLDYISEPGNFELMIGSSSNDIRCKDTFELLK